MSINTEVFNQALAQIEKTNASEINGDLKSYFTVIDQDNGRYKIRWEKSVSTHIRHKVAALVKANYVAPKVK